MHVSLQLGGMRTIFNEFDSSGNWSIDLSDLKKVFKKLEKSLSDQELQRMIDMADEDKSGTVNYEEFIAHMFGKK